MECFATIEATHEPPCEFGSEAQSLCPRSGCSVLQLSDGVVKKIAQTVSDHFCGIISDKNVIHFLSELATQNGRVDLAQGLNFSTLMSIACYCESAAVEIGNVIDYDRFAHKLIDMLRNGDISAKKFMQYGLGSAMRPFRNGAKTCSNFLSIFKKALADDDVILQKFIEAYLESFHFERNIGYIVRGDQPKTFPLVDVFGELCEEESKWARTFAKDRIGNRFVAQAFAYLANLKDDGSQLRFSHIGDLMEKNLTIPSVAEAVVACLDHCGEYFWSLQMLSKHFYLSPITDSTMNYFRLVGDRMFPFTSVRKFNYVIPELHNINSLIADDGIGSKAILSAINGDIRLQRLFEALILNWRYGGGSPITQCVENRMIEFADADNSWAEEFIIGCIAMDKHPSKFKEWVIKNVTNQNVAQKIARFIDNFPGKTADELFKILSEKYTEDEIKRFVRRDREQEIRKLTKAMEIDLIPLHDDDTRRSIEKNKQAIIGCASSGDWKKAMRCLAEISAIGKFYHAPISAEHTVEESTFASLQHFADKIKFSKPVEIQREIQESEGFETFDFQRFGIIFLLLRNLGKCIGQNPMEQSLFTLPIMQYLMNLLGMPENEILLAQSLAQGDIFDEYKKTTQMSTIPISHAALKIQNLSKQAKISAKSFCRMLQLLCVDEIAKKGSSADYLIDIILSHLAKIPENLATRINKLLAQENLHPTTLFDSTNFDGDYNVFEVAKYYLDNYKALSERFPSFNKYESIILEMSKFAILLKDDQYQPDHVEWVIRFRLQLRQSEQLAAIFGKTPRELMDSNPAMVKFFEDFRKIIQTEIDSHVDVFKFFEAYYYTSSRTSRAFKLL
ncbi:MAG: hypothetical protein LBB15_00655, partial [Puniceicoccales bacterium]|nr:hypothetical protein [Puniceicoccales bacterium]